LNQRLQKEGSAEDIPRTWCWHAYYRAYLPRTIWRS